MPRAHCLECTENGADFELDLSETYGKWVAGR